MPYKTCPNCNQKSGVRTYICKCGYEFIDKNGVSKKVKEVKESRRPKNRVKKMVETDWQTLNVGEKIKVVKGSGPYRIKDNGDRISFGHSGDYTVKEIQQDGLLATQKGMIHFIYMGEPRMSPTETHLVAHKILTKEKFS